MGEQKHTPAELRAKLTLWLRKDAIEEFYLWGDGTEDRAEDAADMIDADAARITELEAHCLRLGQGDAERYWEARYRDEAAANAHLHAEIARKDEALSELIFAANDIVGADPTDERAMDAFDMFSAARLRARSALSNATTPETGGGE